MPSWNIHIAQAERVFSQKGSVARIVRDRNAFLFGCFVPDIYVGYMVPAVELPIAYRITHLAAPAHIPKPREREFWETYVVPAAKRAGIARDAVTRAGDASAGAADASDLILPASLKAEAERVSRVHYPQRYEGVPEPPSVACAADTHVDAEAVAQSVFDLVLGTWLHLVADNLWNTRVNEFLDAIGGKPSEEFRIKKQDDFDLFGKALPIDSLPRVTPRLVAAAAAFPQYTIGEAEVRSTIGVAHEIVRTNHGDRHPTYRLLTEEFFAQVFTESVALPDRLFTERLG